MVKERIEKAYCEKCDEDVFFDTHIVKRTAVIRGIRVEYNHTIATCKECKERVYPVSVGKQNDILKYDSYKKMVGLLTSQDIIELRKKLKLSQVDFAKKLGCGEKTIARYENGAIQEKVIDNFIREIRNKETFSCATIIYGNVVFSSKNQILDNIVPNNTTTAYGGDLCLSKSGCCC